eukprot:333194-Pleurochrysis_carterae.AAC.2
MFPAVLDQAQEAVEDLGSTTNANALNKSGLSSTESNITEHSKPDKRLQVYCLWTVLASFVLRRRGLERYSGYLLDELKGEGPAAALQGRRPERSR